MDNTSIDYEFWQRNPDIRDANNNIKHVRAGGGYNISGELTGERGHSNENQTELAEQLQKLKIDKEMCEEMCSKNNDCLAYFYDEPVGENKFMQIYSSNHRDPRHTLAPKTNKKWDGKCAHITTKPATIRNMYGSGTTGGWKPDDTKLAKLMDERVDLFKKPDSNANYQRLLDTVAPPYTISMLIGGGKNEIASGGDANKGEISDGIKLVSNMRHTFIQSPYIKPRQKKFDADNILDRAGYVGLFQTPGSFYKAEEGAPLSLTDWPPSGNDFLRDLQTSLSDGKCYLKAVHSHVDAKIIT